MTQVPARSAPTVWPVGGLQVRYPLFAVWVVMAVAETASMWLSPGDETVPYHLGYIGLAIAYELEVWPPRRANAALIAFTAVTGAILVLRAAQGEIAWEETGEIPLMSGLMFIVMSSVRRRHEALETLARVAAKERLRASLRERLTRMTSHEMRTPATIASGYTELLLAQETDDQRRGDLEVVQAELRRLVLASDRLVRAIQIPEQDARGPVDVGRLVRETVDRWHVVADRHWVADADAVQLVCSADRLRAALDTLVENALRYTEDGDTIRVVARTFEDHLTIGVADSGSGLHPQLAQSLNGVLAADGRRYVAADPKAQTGFGLALVDEVASVRGGHLVAGRSAEGGALILMLLPVDDAPTRPTPTVGDSTVLAS